MEAQLSLLELLSEAELQQYYEGLKSDLKVHKPTQLKYVADEDLAQLGMSRPERRRLHKFYQKHFSPNYFTKLRRLLGPPKRGDGSSSPGMPSESCKRDNDFQPADGRVGNKHIIPAENIVINKELGTGEFGVVQQGVWTDAGHGIQVAIKCLYREQMHTNAMEFLKEAAMMHDIEHKNIVRLYGVVLHPQSLMLVTELAPLRSLLECLKELSLRSTFTVLTLCDFAVQICEGMEYLESKRLIHRDLAARNILVFSRNKVKISDFGLSRALGAGKDYYQTNFNVNLKLPIAWCAPECISYLRFTSASDVWAYAVTLWEMFSYGFQPWAAFSGYQILNAIDTPNCQRLEQPECCPKEYYSLMLKCWTHEPTKRPRFADIVGSLPECKPEQVQAITLNSPDSVLKKVDNLNYKIGDVITVLDKTLSPNLWKGILNSGTVGFFNPLNTVSYLGSALPSSAIKNNLYQSSMDFGGSSIRSALIRNDKDRSTISRRKIRSDMISAPQGEVKHTGHVGLDGAYFGDVSFLENNSLPRQVVTPYKPSEDLEQTPLINPNSPSHLTGNSGLPPHSLFWRENPDNMTDAVDSIANVDNPDNLRDYGNITSETASNFNFDSFPQQKSSSKFKWLKKKETNGQHENNGTHNTDVKDSPDSETQLHDYQEISDDDQKSTEFGQSLLDEMELMFQNYGESSKSNNSSNDFVSTNHHNELVELNTRMNVIGFTTSNNKKKHSVKPISAHDKRTLDSAIALANKISVKSMTDLETEEPTTPVSPVERSKFSFRFPLVGHHSGSSQNSIANSSNTITHGNKHERRNFSQEAQSVPDIQTSLTDECKLAYESLVEQPCRLESTLMKNMAPIQNAIQTSLNVEHDMMMKKQQFELEKKKIADFESLVSIETVKTSSPDTVDTGKPFNPIPVPPRDHTKHIDAGKRHIRKHPLVMQVNNGERYNTSSPTFSTFKPNSPTVYNRREENFVLPSNTVQYYNVNDNMTSKSNPFDMPSLNFEAQIENDLFSVDCCDGIGNVLDFETDIQPGSNLRHQKRVDKFNVDQGSHNTLLNDNVNTDILFIDDSPDRESLNTDNFDTTNNLTKHLADRVSVEDLLEFADQKPCGRQRGKDSDEVRIMCKVLNQQVTPEACLLALEFASWNVHRAIKLAKLRFMGLDSPTLYDCSVALEACDWDVVRAATTLADSADITQV